MLYPAELQALIGRGRGIRTPDILLPKQTRYQTALYPGLIVLLPRDGQLFIFSILSDFYCLVKHSLAFPRPLTHWLGFVMLCVRSATRAKLRN